MPPDSIDTVLCTHLHVDHVGWNTRLVGGKWVPTFANARYVFGKTEYEHWRDHSDEPDKIAVFNDSVKPIVDAGKADLVASDARLCDEITLIPTPGHSPGHISLHIQSDGEEACSPATSPTIPARWPIWTGRRPRIPTPCSRR